MLFLLYTTIFNDNLLNETNQFQQFVDQILELFRDPGFQVGGGALKKIAPSRGRREIFEGISCEKSGFYAKKSYFIHIAEGSANFFGVFRVKNHDFTQKIMFFPILGGARAGCASPWIRPWRLWYFSCVSFINMLYNNIKL